MRYSRNQSPTSHRARRGGAACVAAIGALLLAGAAQAEECSFDMSDEGVWRLLADCETSSTIFVPDGVTLAGKGHTITAVEETPGDWRGAIVQNEGASSIVQDLVLTTDDLECVCRDGADRLQGIRFDGGAGVIRRNLLVGINKGDCACQEGTGIVVSNPPFDGSGGDDTGVAGDGPEVKITANHLREYQKAGIVVSGNVTATISNNMVRGAGPSETIGQNGIQVGFGAAADVVSNTVLGHRFRGSASATGILVFESDGVQVLRNDVANNETGIAVESWCWYAPSANANRIAQNSVDNARVGVSITAMAYDAPFSDCSPTADRNAVVNNLLATDVGFAAVSILAGVECDDCDLSPETKDSFVRANRTDGFEYQLIETRIVDRAKSRSPRPQPYWPAR